MAMQLDQLNGLACELKQMDNAPVSIGQVVAAEGEAFGFRRRSISRPISRRVPSSS